MFGIEDLETIVLNVSNVCNMKCGICPNGHDHYKNKYYSNHNISKENNLSYLSLEENDEESNYNDKKFMSINTAKKIEERLKEIDFKGLVSITGFGEPLLNPDIVEITECFKYFKTNLITNGIKLTNASYPGGIVFSYPNYDLLDKLTENIDMIEITLHGALDYSLSSDKDDEDYYRVFKDIRNLYKGKITIRNHNIFDEKNTLRFNNRNGALYNYYINDNKDALCYYVFYEFMIDSDGIYRFCAHDWNRVLDLCKNVNNCRIDDFFLKEMNHIREIIVKDNKRCSYLCSRCDTDGRLHGEDHFIKFKEDYKKDLKKELGRV